MKKMHLLAGFIAVVSIASLVSLGPAKAQTSPPSCLGLAKGFLAQDRSCLCTDELDRRIQFIETALRLGVEAQMHGCDFADNVDNLCGSYLNEKINFIEVTPAKATLDPGDTVQLSAVIKGVLCFNCQPKSSLACVLEGALKGDIVWAPTNPEVASVDQNGFVTALTLGTTTIIARYATSTDINIEGSASITVGDTTADIVFVIETSIDMGFWIGIQEGDPGLIDHGENIIDGVRANFGSDARIAIVTYNRPPIFPYNNFCNPNIDCGSDLWGPGYDAPCAAATDHMSFRFPFDVPQPHLGFESLKVNCGFARWGGYVGSFVYSALMHAIDGESLDFWREEVLVDDKLVKVPKIIVLIAFSRPGGFLNPDLSGGPYLNDPEPFTGFTRETVIQEAQQEDVEIHIFNVQRSLTRLLDKTECCAIREGSREVFTRIANETGGTYSEPEFSGSFPGELLYLGIIDKMDEMGKQSE